MAFVGKKVFDKITVLHNINWQENTKIEIYLLYFYCEIIHRVSHRKSMINVFVKRIETLCEMCVTLSLTLWDIEIDTHGCAVMCCHFAHSQSPLKLFVRLALSCSFSFDSDVIFLWKRAQHKREKNTKRSRSVLRQHIFSYIDSLIFRSIYNKLHIFYDFYVRSGKGKKRARW